MLDAVVIGGGWAGLGVSYALRQAGVHHRLIERGRIGETWRTQRWASFKMNTPNVQTVMPGDDYVGPQPLAACWTDVENSSSEHQDGLHAGR